MRFDPPLIEGIFLKRYKRFFADVQIGDDVVVAHVPNTGSMQGLNIPGTPCLVSPATNPERKLRFTLEMIKTPTSWVGVNTGHPNQLVRELWTKKVVPHWLAYDQLQSEIKINNETRLDGVMWNSAQQTHVKNGKLTQIEGPLHFIELKNVTLGEGSKALFPDAVTERGQKHILEMMELIDRGFSCEFIFVVQREDCTSFSAADAIDPEYGRLLRQAMQKGLLVTALPCTFEPTGITLSERPLQLDL